MSDECGEAAALEVGQRGLDLAIDHGDDERGGIGGCRNFEQDLRENFWRVHAQMLQKYSDGKQVVQ